MTEEVSIVEFSGDIATAEAPVPLPMRQYPATIRKVEAKVSEKGNRYAAVSFYISTDDYPADYPTDNAPDGTTLVFRRVGLDDNAPTRFRLRKFLETIGAPVSSRISLNDWVGLTCQVAIKHEEYEGEPRAVIDKVLKA
jgi:hypothetical protein